jgi:hypothetical protein
VLHTVKNYRNILHTVKWRKANWICHVLRRNCFLKQDIEGMIEVKERRERRRKQLRYNLKAMRGSWKLRNEALDYTVWRTRFASVYVPVLILRNEWMNCKGV